ncbi:hypothetical protein GOP47_0014653 [Adiantum capillus-veneris]|uniref:Uncharacterized protein n=1 Tax=Adiantum capillus-veneris TaxID=13818 RepID=A0A9D4UM38_ADICA|nr:hypothetical protein GOP47_0014653 [Adiantum capillus-veneris]
MHYGWCTNAFIDYVTFRGFHPQAYVGHLVVAAQSLGWGAHSEKCLWIGSLFRLGMGVATTLTVFGKGDIAHGSCPVSSMKPFSCCLGIPGSSWMYVVVEAWMWFGDCGCRNDGCSCNVLICRLSILLRKTNHSPCQGLVIWFASDGVGSLMSPVCEVM